MESRHDLVTSSKAMRQAINLQQKMQNHRNKIQPNRYLACSHGDRTEVDELPTNFNTSKVDFLSNEILHIKIRERMSSKF